MSDKPQKQGSVKVGHAVKCWWQLIYQWFVSLIYNEAIIDDEGIVLFMLGPCYTNHLSYSIELIVLSVYYLTHVVTIHSLVQLLTMVLELMHAWTCKHVAIIVGHFEWITACNIQCTLHLFSCTVGVILMNKIM